jgi:hypothetical protein
MEVASKKETFVKDNADGQKTGFHGGDQRLVGHFEQIAGRARLLVVEATYDVG